MFDRIRRALFAPPALPCPSCDSLTEELETIQRAFDVTAIALERALADVTRRLSTLAREYDDVTRERDEARAQADRYRLHFLREPAQIEASESAWPSSRGDDGLDGATEETSARPLEGG